MPASVNETVTASLLLSLSAPTKCGPENGEIPLEQRMIALAKKALLTEIEYEVSEDTYHSAVIEKLKAKYADPEEKPIKNGSNSQNVGVKGSIEAGQPCLPTPVKVLFPMERVNMQWPQRCSNGSGLSNGGNSCYINSVLQVLFHIPPMVNWLMEGDQHHQRTCNTYINSTTECIICCLAVTLKHSQLRTGSDFKPHLILARLRSICKRMVPGQQEDAMEFLRYLFEAMEKSYLQRFSGMRLDSNSKETTPLNQIFGGYIRTDVTCLYCRGVSTTFQHFLDLTLDISRGPSIDIALQTYFSQERLEGDNSYRCDKCRRKVPAAKQFFIERLPNVLCIQLKRFNIEGKKISKSIQLSERINLQKFMSRPKLPPGSMQQQQQQMPKGAFYRLHASVNHLGNTAQSGHYTATTYTSSGNLYIFDDSSVQRCCHRNFSGSDVYLLMYMMEGARPENGRPNNSLPTPSATTTSQGLQTVVPRLPAKLASHPNFIPVQCRNKPGNLLNQNHKIVFHNSPAKDVKSPSADLIKPRNPLVVNIANKSSKLVTPSVYVSKDPTASKFTAQSSLASSSNGTGKERNNSKLQNGPVQSGSSKSSLVPYSEEHSSGEEGENSRKSSHTKDAPITNGWTVTSSKNNHVLNNDKAENESTESVKKLATKLPESPKLQPKVNGMDTWKNSPKVNQELTKKANKPVISASENVSGKKHCDADSSSLAGSECSVRSTSSTWHVSPVAATPEKNKVAVAPQPAVPTAEPRAATASWEVTSAPTSAEQSPGTVPATSPSQSPSKHKQLNNHKHHNNHKGKRSRHSSSSSDDSSSESSSSSESEASKRKVWVERTKDTIFGNGDRSNHRGIKRPAFDNKPEADTSRLNVADELRKMSHAGYGGAQVTTWNGGRSLVDRQVREDYYERRKQYDNECNYDSEMDGGRRKKVKTSHDYQKNDEYSRVNRFQQEADDRRNGHANYHDRSGSWGSRKEQASYYKSNHNRNWHSSKPYHNNYHNRNQQHNYRGNNNWNRHHSNHSSKQHYGRDYDDSSKYHRSHGHRNHHR